MKVGQGASVEYVTSQYAIARELLGLRKSFAIAAITSKIYGATEKEVRKCLRKNKDMVRHWSRPRVLKTITYIPRSRATKEKGR